jgi:hypothetical protein
MGAIFNTRGTIAILKFLNNHYQPGATHFDRARANGEYNVLRAFATYPDSYSCAIQLGLQDPTVNPRWKRWLDFLDAYQQGGVSGGQLVRLMMADALDPVRSPNCYGIEFFAVPSSGFFIQDPPPQIPDQSSPGRYTSEIVVETNTVDNMASIASYLHHK